MARQEAQTKVAKAPKAAPVAAADKKEKVTRVVRRVVKKADAEPVTNVADTVVDTPVAETPGDEIVTPGGTRKRREVTAESVDETFGELLTLIESEITRQRDLKEKNSRAPGGGIKFLRTTLKRTKQLQADVRRIARKKRVARVGNNNSGFMKEARLSDAMAEFLGVSHGSSMSRVECTKKLHAYILENNLQNPENRREILPNKELTKLLKYNKKSVEEGGHGPLFYYVMQKLIQQHFVKDTPAE